MNNKKDDNKDDLSEFKIQDLLNLFSMILKQLQLGIRKVLAYQ